MTRDLPERLVIACYCDLHWVTNAKMHAWSAVAYRSSGSWSSLPWGLLWLLLSLKRWWVSRIWVSRIHPQITMFKIMSELSISKQNVYLNSCDVLVARRWLNAFVNKGNHNPSKCSTTSVHGCRYSRPHSCEWRTGKHHKHMCGNYVSTFRSQMSSDLRPHSCEWRTRKHHNWVSIKARG